MPRFLAPLLVPSLLCTLVLGQDFRPGGPVDGGVRATADIPASLHIRNVGGVDGAGLCVFTSLEVSSRWQRSGLDGFQAWMKKRPGGGWPEKLDEMLVRFCREKGVQIPQYVQHTGGDEEFLELALKTGRMPSVTYAGRDDFYSGRIAHMVDLAHLDESRAAIIDNNRPGVWVWMSRKDFLTRWRDMNGGWAVVLLEGPPPPYTKTPANFVAEQLCPPGQPCELVFVPGIGWVRQVKPAPALAQPAAPADKPAAPVAEPVKPAEPKEELKGLDNGVDPAKVHNSARWYVNGAESNKDEVMRAVAGDGLADDSAKWFLICVGTPEQVAVFKASAAALNAATRDKLHVKAYQSDAWEVGQFDLPAGVSLRKAARGRVGAEAGRLAGVAVTPESVRTLVDAAMNPVPQPMPTPVPPPADPTPAPAVPAVAPATWLILALGAVVLFLLFRRK